MFIVSHSATVDRRLRHHAFQMIDKCSFTSKQHRQFKKWRELLERENTEDSSDESDCYIEPSKEEDGFGDY